MSASPLFNGRQSKGTSAVRHRAIPISHLEIEARATYFDLFYWALERLGHRDARSIHLS
jgi:hypothetical protein